MGRAEARRAQQSGGRRRAAQRSGIRRFINLKTVFGTFFGFLLLGMAGFVALYLYVDIPAKANNGKDAQSNTYLYANGKLLARDGGELNVNREIVTKDQVPRHVRYAFVAAENKSFYTDPGVDFKGMAGGLFRTLKGEGKHGGSTITQQYVKNYYLTDDPTITRKLKELVIALKVESKKTKDEILLGYLNSNFYGRRADGIQAAARAYYGKDVDQLKVEEAAYLAALVQAPSQYDWAIASETGKKLVKGRWEMTLDRMVEIGELDAAERAKLEFPVPIEPKPTPGMEGQNGYLVEAAKKELERNGVDMTAFDKLGGWTVTLNIEPERQKALEKAVDDQLEANLDREGSKVDKTVQAGATSVDPKTGRIVAMYGGTNYVEHFRNNATRTDYQPGSTFKPIVLASALENDSETQDGRPINLNTIYDGTSRRPVEGSTTAFDPQNLDDRDYGDANGDITVLDATASSVNSVYAQMVVDVGTDKAKQTALDLGMADRNMPERPAIVLGTANASTLEMAGVYATFSNHGKKVTPSILKKVEKQGVAKQLEDVPDSRVLDRETADTVTKALTEVVKKGSGTAVLSDAYEAAGKTGTTERNLAAWFAGYTPELATVVALFGEDMDKNSLQVSLHGAANLERTNGGGFPAKIWAQYTLGALDGSHEKFDLTLKEGSDIVRRPTPSTSPTETETEEPEESPSEEPTTSSPPPPPAEPTKPTKPAKPTKPTETATQPTDDPSEPTEPTGTPDPSDTETGWDDGNDGNGDNNGNRPNG